MPQVKIVAVGAASASFGLTILRDILGCRELDGSELVLVDINEGGLDLMRRAGERLAQTAATATRVRATTDIGAALPDASYVITSVAVARLPGWRMDWEVPLQHGIKHVFAENGGVGGLFQLCRNLPPILNAARAMEKHCPDALLINFSNPLPRIICALDLYTGIRAVGLCHGFENTRGLLAGWLGLPPHEIHATAAGINHFTWILDLRRRGTNEDLYPRVKEICFSDSPPHEEPFLQALYRRFGLFPTCGDAHTAEFLPPEMFEEIYPFQDAPPWRLDFDGAENYRGDLAGRLLRLAEGQENGTDLLAGEPTEYLRPLILAIETDQEWLCPALTVPTRGYVANLPPAGALELPVLVNGRGLHPLHLGEMPEGPACFIAQQLLIQPLAARAAVEGNRDAALQALSLEPCVGSLRKAEAVFDDLLSRQIRWLPQFRAS
ncbi:MAG: alpha-glucosidase/alpha-galactosidase [Armatimonadetes bacterium]|nr:alpha-glucosidase/alpha-galactosidase [Armatimonadota bacterium]